MAIHTPSHGQAVHLLDHIHLLNVAMALLTGDKAVFRLAEAMHVAFVIELHVIGQHVHLHPLDGFAVKIFFLKFFDRLFVGGDEHVTVHARVQTGNRRVLRVLHVRVTVQARNFVIACVLFMGKRQRLRRAYPVLYPICPHLQPVVVRTKLTKDTT